MKIAIILEEYLKYAEQKTCSAERIRSSVKLLNENLPGTLDHTRISESVLRRYRRDEDLEPSTINRDYIVLRSALRYAKEELGLIRQAPAIPKRRGAAISLKWMTTDQMEVLFAEARKYPGIYLFVLLAWLTGQRLQAILGLRWSQVDFERNVIWFNQHGLPLAERRKNRGTVPIDATLRSVLEQHRNDSPYVIVRSCGARFLDINRDHWKAVVTAAGVPDVTPHTIRHSVATNLLRDGEQLLFVSKLLGHSNVSFTAKHYLKFQPEFLGATMNRLGAIVK
jgi:integrase